MGIIIIPIRQIRTKSLRSWGTSPRTKWLSQDTNSDPPASMVFAGFMLPPAPSRNGLGAQAERTRLAQSTHEEPVVPSSSLVQARAAAFSFCRLRLVFYEPRTAARFSY